MGYNRFGTPRAYIDLVSYFLATGWQELDDITILQDGGGAVTLNNNTHKASLFDMKPHTYARIDDATQRFFITIDTEAVSPIQSESNFIAILNHNMSDADIAFNINLDDDVNFGSATTISASTRHTKIINAEQNTSSGFTNYIHPAKNGWTLIKWDTIESDSRYVRIGFTKKDNANSNFSEDLVIGGILYGEYVDFPRSPDLEIETSVVYGNVKLQQSVGGSTYSNTASFGKPTWFNSNPWNLTIGDNSTYSLSRVHGRITHSLKFSYVADTELYASGDSGAWFDSSALHSSFYNRIAGQHLPFMFTLDGDSTSEQDYGLFRLANDNFTANQVAHRIWNTSLDLVETW